MILSLKGGAELNLVVAEEDRTTKTRENAASGDHEKITRAVFSVGDAVLLLFRG